MPRCGFHIGSDQSWAETLPEALQSAMVTEVLELLRRRYPEDSLEVWHDSDPSPWWQFTVEGRCRVEVHGEQILLSGVLVDAGLEDDLPALSKLTPVASLTELEERLP